MKQNPGVTLIELIIALCIFSVMFLGFATIQLYSRYHFLTSQRRAVVQNEVAFVLEHMAKNITGTAYCGGAIGDKGNFPVTPFTILGNNGIAIRVDSNRNGKLDLSDGQIAYIYDATAYRVLFYPNAADASTGEYLTRGRIRGDFSADSGKETFVSYDPSRNWLDITITGRWDPSKDPSRDNPQVIMRSRIQMPAVSTN